MSVYNRAIVLFHLFRDFTQVNGLRFNILSSVLLSNLFRIPIFIRFILIKPVFRVESSAFLFGRLFPSFLLLDSEHRFRIPKKNPKYEKITKKKIYLNYTHNEPSTLTNSNLFTLYFNRWKWLDKKIELFVCKILL